MIDPALAGGFVYLASQSPRRRQLLDQIRVRYEMLLPREDEDAESLEDERVGELPLDYVRRVTRAKLAAARRRLTRTAAPVAPILCADTTVALGRRILGKPRTRLNLKVTASTARREEARVLETKVGAPVLIREHIWYFEPEGPMQYGKSVFRGDRYQMSVDFTAAPHGQSGER